MDKNNILASHKFVLAKEDDRTFEYHYKSMVFGKLHIPLKFRIRWIPHKSHVIALQFLDTPFWTNCNYHKFIKHPFSSKYHGRRKFKNWSIRAELIFPNHVHEVIINIYNPEWASDITGSI